MILDVLVRSTVPCIILLSCKIGWVSRWVVVFCILFNASFVGCLSRALVIDTRFVRPFTRSSVLWRVPTAIHARPTSVVVGGG